MKQKRSQFYRMMFGLISVLSLFGSMAVVKASTTVNDGAYEYYTEINNDGDIIAGNQEPVKSGDKLVIRPAYLGNSFISDTISPKGVPFTFYGKPGDLSSISSYRLYPGDIVLNKNIGFYQGRPLMLKTTFADVSLDSVQPTFTALLRDGSMMMRPMEKGTYFQVFYADGLKEVVKDVLIELPIEFSPSRGDSYLHVATEGLKRVYLNDPDEAIGMKTVSDEEYDFYGEEKGSLGKLQKKPAIQVKNTVPEGLVRTLLNGTFIFENNQPLIIGEEAGRFTQYTYTFKSELKTPAEIIYPVPKANSISESENFALHFDITQALSDGYNQYFPEYLSIVMEDEFNMFNSVDDAVIKFTNNENQIIDTVKTEKISPHQLEFKVTKETLLWMKNNQINLDIVVGNLNEKQVKSTLGEDGDYHVPVTFYNYKKTAKGEIVSSDRVKAISIIKPSIFAQSADREVFVGAKRNDLLPEEYLKNMATTIPNDTLTAEFVDTSAAANQEFSVLNQTYTFKVRIKSNENKQLAKVIDVSVKATRGVLIEPAFFDNQPWIINLINKQLGKTIGKDVYMSDLMKITELVSRNPKPNYTNQFIPKNISELKNLVKIDLANTQFKGEIPAEVGQLSKLEQLILFGNNFSGSEIPATLGNLSELKTLTLDDNQLGGEIPASLSKLSKLSTLYLDKNNLVGKIPDFNKNQLFVNFHLDNNQVTYNSTKAPEIGGKGYTWANTLIVGGESYSLFGKQYLPIDKPMVIKPFDPKNIGFFDLSLKKGSTKQELFAGHTFSIREMTTNKIVYENGLADSNKTIRINSLEDKFEVIMDGADQNPNNRFEVSVRKQELKFISVPTNLKTTNLTTDNLTYQPVYNADSKVPSLMLFDNREESNWDVRVSSPKKLTASDGKVLAGTFNYRVKAGMWKEITPTETSVETGKSLPDSGEIDVFKEWSSVKNKERGLFFKQDSNSNFKGDYSGQLNWFLYDVPN
ncbi:hypothetical protein [uncultured Vagococcus sp.]|uniref:leucine-rich repeat domain-containing protein n=1 Tax=uncultured Vagococcus sp. TaxID=189676 RepID=UPI0028D79CE6|nr:hypothetical protein [uncultured Vagococcus sp.]